MLATWLGSVLGGTRGGAASDVWQAGVPDVIDLGTVAPGESATATLWLHNTGATPLTGVAILATLVGGPHRHPPRLMTIPTVVPELPPGRPCAVEIHVTTERATAEGDFVWELTSEGAPNVVRVFLVVADSPAFEPAPTQFVSRLRVYASMVRRAMLEQIPTGEPANYLYQLVREYPYRPGKHMRAAICLSICEALGGSATGALDIASSLELLHNALLIHDDIQDESEERRGRPTLHMLHGVPLALNAGDMLSLMSLRPLIENRRLIGDHLTLRIIEETERMAHECAEGQALELGWRRDNTSCLEDEDYLEMVLKKTCWLATIYPIRVGALIGTQDSVNLDEFSPFGFLLGATFQIQDDLLNLAADRSYGKELNGDIWEGKRTLMLIRLFREASVDERARLSNLMSLPREQRSACDVTWIRQLMDKYDCVEYARQIAHGLAGAALQEFSELSAGLPDSRDKRFLEEMVTWVIERT